ncbi:site-specific DNA-methyltransferase [Limosilactobacillus mucosae]|uniref:Site-specific DNA-methyltransferase n=1 Tax=Limosilactobacillus mucosae TaxID=97478 RepID=A0AAJ1M9G7_LIMMU|nr:site-specific DNA-methyltransferase [Limosilactobacillus mucosae]MDC2830337.1 site-specific DNA-methyltransferase [Limosilactobacillus mucosae]MDC2837911.1 site-specific DNA-methyltransferase [Limosilactobacillus mucosae]MDC2849924.1 site-specific DNA-methyltransferase [Limosilactobacillus mucosae]MDC2854172.1 site-specific DNA-methyltransferase [Limosilactobacillus mucosae]
METDNQRFNATVQPNSAFLVELKEKLPEFFTRENSFDLEKFQAALKEKNVSELSEGYQLNFIGKDYARRQAGEMPTTVIVPDENQNNGAGKNSQNLFFTGDNLEVLRHLQNNYQNKIDVIYIDPPYNTGSDGFVYPDSFEYSDDKLKEMFGMNDDQVARLKSIQGRSSHSSWLTFMYPRLFLAKRLLSQNGVIFISIDENEVYDLSQLLSMTFGESNLDTLIWNKESDGKSGSLKAVNRFRKIHEYILLAYKNKDINFNKVHEPLKGRETEFATANLAVNSNIENKNHPNYFTITNPLGDQFTRQWKWSKEKITSLKKENLIYWGSDGHKQPRLIIPFDNRRTVYLQSILNYGSTTLGRLEFEKLIDKDVFSYPKPTALIKKILAASSKKYSTVLDFFAGSSTTADAVMQLNAEDGGHRKFIMVQLPEKTYHTNSDGSEVPTKGGKAAYEAGFRSIDEISRERIRRAAAKIKADNELTLPTDFDGSFKHYRVVKPNRIALERIEEFKPDTDELVLDTVTAFSSDALGVAGNASGEQTVLATWLAKDGYAFDADIQKIDLAGYQGNLVENNRLYLIRENWSSKCTEKLLNLLGTHELNVQAVVIFGYSFNLNDLRELENGLKQLDGNVSLIKRY